MNSYIDLKRAINDRTYAKTMHLNVNYYKSNRLKELERALKELSNNDADWKDKVANYKNMIKEGSLNSSTP